MTDKTTPQNLEDLSQDLNTDDENINSETSKNEVEKLLNKNKELLVKLAKSKSDNKTLLAENESLKNIKAEFEAYKIAEYEEDLLLNVLRVFPEHKEFIKFKLHEMGYKVIYADDTLLRKASENGFDRVQVNGYCFVNADGHLVTADDIRQLQNQFGDYCRGSGATGSNSKPTIFVLDGCKFEHGVLVGKPNTKTQVITTLEVYKKELADAQRLVDFYNAQIPELEKTRDRLPNQVASIDDLNLGLK